MANILICIGFCFSTYDINEYDDDDHLYVIDQIDHYLECKEVTNYKLLPIQLVDFSVQQNINDNNVHQLVHSGTNT